MTETKAVCSQCKSANFGVGSGEPVQMSGWYGDKRFAWGRYAGVPLVKLTGLRCADCGHVETVDPDWD